MSRRIISSTPALRIAILRGWSTAPLAIGTPWRLVPCRAAAVIWLFLAALLPTASAVVILNDNFDSYANTAAFSAVWTPIGTDATNPGALISTSNWSSFPNSVSVPGTTVDNRYRNRRGFTETSTYSTSGNLAIGDTLIWSFDFYDSQSPVSNPQRNYSNLQDSPGQS